MGLRTIVGTKDGRGTVAVLYCSTSERALPWLFDSEEDADAFVEAHGDVRGLTPAEQESVYEAWQARAGAA